MASIKCLHGGTEHRHDSVQAVRQCVGAVAAYVGGDDGYRGNGIDLDRELYPPEDHEAAYGTVQPPEHEAPAAAREKRWTADEVGVYKVGDIYYKVQQSRSSGHLYAKRACREDDKWAWEYAKGAMREIFADNKLTQKQAHEFGHLYKTCVYCFSELTREESMDRGYGPTCADNHGLEYDHSRN